MGRGTVEKFGLRAIADALRGSDVQSARGSLSQLVGAVVREIQNLTRFSFFKKPLDFAESRPRLKFIQRRIYFIGP